MKEAMREAWLSQIWVALQTRVPGYTTTHSNSTGLAALSNGGWGAGANCPFLCLNPPPLASLHLGYRSDFQRPIPLVPLSAIAMCQLYISSALRYLSYCCKLVHFKVQIHHTNYGLDTARGSVINCRSSSSVTLRFRDSSLRHYSSPASPLLQGSGNLLLPCTSCALRHPTTPTHLC